jgi:hypothetical protein
MADAINTQIWILHKSLGKTVQNLSKRLGNTSDPKEAEEILREIEEVNFRTMMAGRLLFKITTESINKRIDDLVGEISKVDDGIKTLEKTEEVVKSISKFLGTVDVVLDKVKLLVG